jgi:hypothetical protein
VQHTGNIGTVDLSIDLSGITTTGVIGQSSNFRLMVDADGDGNFATGTPTFYNPAGFSGNKANFTSVTLGNNVVFTLVTLASFTGNQSPTASSITSPVNNASFAAGGNITLTATATDPDNNLTKVEFYQGTTKLGEATTAPYSFTWNNVIAGTYSITAKAIDAGGLSFTSSIVTILVPASPSWSLSGNSGTTAGNHFIGTTDNQRLVFKSNNTEALTVLPGGNVGIGTSTPTASLQVAAPSVANRDAGPFQFALTNGPVNRFYVAHDAAATRMSLLDPSGAVGTRFDVSPGGLQAYSDRSMSLSAATGYNLSYDAGFHIFMVNGTEAARLSQNGFGIGTTAPAAPLQIAPAAEYTAIDGTPSFLIYGQLTSANIAMGIGGNTGTSNILQSRSDAAGTFPMSINPFGGNVGIGTANPQATLAVNGDIFAKKVKVTPNGWSDYVFEKDYRLPSLADLEKYVQQHRHLPDVPATKEVMKDGIDLGDNQSILLKKIEELTLYIIEQNKRIESLEKKLKDK